MVKSYASFKPRAVLGVVGSSLGASSGFGFASGTLQQECYAVAVLRLASRSSSSSNKHQSYSTRPASDRDPKKPSHDLLVAVVAIEAVHVWNVKRGILVARLCDAHVQSPVTSLVASHDLGTWRPSRAATEHSKNNGFTMGEEAFPSSFRIAVGYADGNIRVYALGFGCRRESADTQNDTVSRRSSENQLMPVLACFGGADTMYGAGIELLATFQGHRSGISSMSMRDDGSILVSGSRDGDIFVWDIVAEQGLFRFRDAHQDMVTRLLLFSRPALAEKSNDDDNLLASSSKDGVVKIWDLNLQNNVQTLVGHRGEVWCMHYLHQKQLLIVGSVDQSLHVWKRFDRAKDSFPAESITGEIFESIGSLNHDGRARIANIMTSESERILACHSVNRHIEFYECRSESAAREHAKRRRKRMKEKTYGSKQDILTGEVVSSSTVTDNYIPTTPNDWMASDFFCKVFSLRLKEKLVGSVFAPYENIRKSSDRASYDMIHLVGHNCIKLERVQLPQAQKLRNSTTASLEWSDEEDGEKESANDWHPNTECLYAIDALGHCDPVRALAFSDEQLAYYDGSRDRSRRVLAHGGPPYLMSVSSSVKIWDSGSGQCIRSIPLTVEDGTVAIMGTCACFLAPPSTSHGSFREGQYAVVGSENGYLLVLDCYSGHITSYISLRDQAERKPVSKIATMAQSPGGGMLATGGSDHCVRFWHVEVTDSPASCTLRPGRTLKLSSEVCAVQYTPDGRLLLVALMDSTVRAFHVDTLNFHLSLYGHKLPVHSMDVSHDSKILVTGSADKSCKVWGLEFGDCHRSFGRAHENGVAVIKFEPGPSHCFWSGGNDGSIRFWDADVSGDHSLIATLEGRGVNGPKGWGHRSGRVMALAISADREQVASAGSDGSIRLWVRADDEILAGEERENQLHQLFEEDAIREAPDDYIGEVNDSDEERESMRGGPAVVTVRPSSTAVKSLDTVAASDRILEALKRNDDASAEKESHCMTKRHEALEVLSHVRSTHLEAALRSLPFTAAMELFIVCSEYIVTIPQKSPRPSNMIETEIIIRCALFLLREHFDTVTSLPHGGESTVDRNVIERIRTGAQSIVLSNRDRIGTNIAALRYLKREMEASQLTVPTVTLSKPTR